MEIDRFYGEFELTCRCCIRSEDSLKLQSLYDYPAGMIGVPQTKSIAELITVTTPSIVISATDGLPQSICYSCLEKLLEVQHFQEMCLTSDQNMRAFLENNYKKKSAATRDNEFSYIDVSEPKNEVIVKEEIELVDVEWSSMEFQNETTTRDLSFDVMEPTNLQLETEILSQNLTLNIPNNDESKLKISKRGEEKLHICNLCGKTYSRAATLHEHKFRHNATPLYECSICPKRFSCGSDLNKHMLTHTEERKHICAVCGVAFKQISLLKRHTKAKHSLEAKSHKCEHCDMCFSRAEHLRRHTRTHTGEKPYKCSNCDKAFSDDSSFIRHLQTHYGDEVYNCDLCPRGFQKSYELRIHCLEHKNEDHKTREQNLAARKRKEEQLNLKLTSLPSKILKHED